MSKEFNKFMVVVGNMNLNPAIETEIINKVTEIITNKMLSDRINPEELEYFYNNTKHIDSELGITAIENFRDAATDDGRCETCFETITDEDRIYENETSEYWGATVSERVEVGYKCHKCGTTKTF